MERFLQPDPSAQDGVRSYVYCRDDPANCADPRGLEGDPEHHNAGGPEAAAAVRGSGSGLEPAPLEAVQGSGGPSNPMAGPEAASDPQSGLAPENTTGQFSIPVPGQWQRNRRQGFPQLNPDDKVLYILKDSQTGTLLKVGKTTGGTLDSRFRAYASVARQFERDLEFKGWTVELPDGVTLSTAEDAFRKAVENAGHGLPWDNSVDPENAIAGGRLGRPGPGTPFVQDDLIWALGRWDTNPRSPYFGMYLNNLGVPWRQAPDYFPRPFDR